MHVVHVTAHLGGGVGKAHAALRAVMPTHIRQTYLLLEDPRDRRYADEIAVAGGAVVVISDLHQLAGLCAPADIVQFEFWNHPKLFECLARADFPAMRSVFWSHISGLFRPAIAPGFLAAADRFVFTTPASMVLGEALSSQMRGCLSSIGSGFGFPDLPINPAIPPSALPGLIGKSEKTNPQSNPVTYLGTVDFVKMHPGFFDAIDALTHDTQVSIWGGYDPAGAVAVKANAMRHPHRIRFMGQTADPQAALRASQVFFYPLRPDHYGTAENALIEAMSLGLVPVVLANPAECAIVKHAVTGLVCPSIEACSAVLDRLLCSPDLVSTIGANAAKEAREKYTPEKSVSAFAELWSSLSAQPRHRHDFARITGKTPLDWYRTTQLMAGEKPAPTDVSRSVQSKGTLAHFKSAFPDDPCWTLA